MASSTYCSRFAWDEVVSLVIVDVTVREIKMRAIKIRTNGKATEARKILNPIGNQLKLLIYYYITFIIQIIPVLILDR
jgi:hypothetical protein